MLVNTAPSPHIYWRNVIKIRKVKSVWGIQSLLLMKERGLLKIKAVTARRVWKKPPMYCEGNCGAWKERALRRCYKANYASYTSLLKGFISPIFYSFTNHLWSFILLSTLWGVQMNETQLLLSQVLNKWLLYSEIAAIEKVTENTMRVQTEGGFRTREAKLADFLLK